MSGISGVPDVTSGAGSVSAPMTTLQATTSPAGTGTLQEGGSSGSGFRSITDQFSMSASMQSTSEVYMYSQSPVLADQQLLGLVVLMLTLEYLQSDDKEEKNSLLAMLLLLTQEQQAGNETFMYSYSSSSLSLDTTQVQSMWTENQAGGYGAGELTDPYLGGGVDTVA